NKERLFLEGILTILGHLEVGENDKAWVLCCEAVNVKTLQVAKRLITMSYQCFNSVHLFTTALTNQFGGIGIGVITKEDIKEYQLHLKESYVALQDPRAFHQPKFIGLVKPGYWYLSEMLQIKNNKVVDPLEVEFLASCNFSKRDVLTIKTKLHKLPTCLLTNKSIFELAESYGRNAGHFGSVLSFVLSRLLSLSRKSAGEANIGLLYSSSEEKNVGKTLLQKVLHYGQGAQHLDHNLLSSGGNGMSSGLSVASVSEVAKLSTMVLNINDTKNSKLQTELMLTLHERLNQGSKKRGTGNTVASGVVMSANNVEPNRLKGRVIRFTFKKEETCPLKMKQMDDLLDYASENQGFLLAWVLVYQDIWLQELESSKNTLVRIISKYTNQDQRWCSSVSLMLYTKVLYLGSMDLANSLTEDIEELVANNPCPLKPSPAETKIEIEKCIIALIKENKEHDLINEIKPKKSIYQSFYYSREGKHCSIKEQKARNDENCEPKRGYKMPLRMFPRLQFWITTNKDNFEKGNFTDFHDLENSEEVDSEESDEDNGDNEDNGDDDGGDDSDGSDGGSNAVHLDNKDLNDLNSLQLRLTELESEFRAGMLRKIPSAKRSSVQNNEAEIVSIDDLQKALNLVMSPKTTNELKTSSNKKRKHWMEAFSYVAKKLRFEVKSSDGHRQQETAESLEHQEQETAESSEQQLQETSERPEQQLQKTGERTEQRLQETAESSEQQETAESSEQQETPENSEQQETAENSEQQETAENSEQQETAESSEQQETPENSEQQETAENSEEQQETAENSEEQQENGFPSGTFGIRSRKPKLLYCSCKKESTDEMIICSGKQCEGNNKYHMKCANVRKAPKRKWLCKSCKKSNQSSSR
uniref:PHD-type domain-containing protein n=1 Tax=Clytia hemisphaerica TaxID=252671 RepID=A0A7M5VBX5_9CNID